MPSTGVLDAPAGSTASAVTARGGKYLLFQLSTEEFGIPVNKVKEILGVQQVTAVPQTPAHVVGVINLRGKVISVVDLRLKFGLPAVEYTSRTCIVVVQVRRSDGSHPMGVVVDGVAEVLNLADADIENTPDFGEGEGMPYVLGLAKVKDKVKILLDIEHVLSGRELHGLNTLLA